MPNHEPFCKRTHLANTFFEKELESKQPRSLEEWMNSHPAVLQLQYLPLLYREPAEPVLVTALPPPPYLDFLHQHNISTSHIELLSHPTPCQLELWGSSEAVLKWAEAHGCKAPLHDWDRVKEVHSKFFSFASAPQLPMSQLLQTADEAADWIDSFEGPKVLKRAFGLAGSGHLFVDKELPPRAIELFERGEPLLGEPWVKRTFDFSTQWKIGEEAEYLGATVLETTERGVYLGTKAGDVSQLFQGHAGALIEHIETATTVVKKIRALGFRGHLGIDAFVYEWKNEKRVRVICEINARKTFGWAALAIRRRLTPGKILHLRFEKSDQPGFLPTHLGKHTFERQLLLHKT